MVRDQENDSSSSVNRKEVLGEMTSTESKRRGVLKGFSATLASTLGLSKLATAEDSIDRDALMGAARKYHSEDKVREQIRTHSDLLKSLANHGHLDSASVSELPVNKLYSSHEEYSAAEDGMIVFGLPQDGEPRAKIEIKKRTSDGNRLVMRIEPERNYSFVLVKSKPDEVIFGRKSSSDRVSTLDCSTGSDDDYCEVFCGPYSCTCYTYYHCGDCISCNCHTHDELCSSCSDPGC